MTIETRIAKNGSTRYYVREENGKLTAISRAKALELQAEIEQAEAEEEEVEIEDTEDVEEEDTEEVEEVEEEENTEDDDNEEVNTDEEYTEEELHAAIASGEETIAKYSTGDIEDAATVALAKWNIAVERLDLAKKEQRKAERAWSKLPCGADDATQDAAIARCDAAEEAVAIAEAEANAAKQELDKAYAEATKIADARRNAEYEERRAAREAAKREEAMLEATVTTEAQDVATDTEIKLAAQSTADAQIAEQTQIVSTAKEEPKMTIETKITKRGSLSVKVNGKITAISKIDALVRQSLRNKEQVELIASSGHKFICTGYGRYEFAHPLCKSCTFNFRDDNGETFSATDMVDAINSVDPFAGGKYCTRNIFAQYAVSTDAQDAAAEAEIELAQKAASENDETDDEPELIEPQPLAGKSLARALTEELNAALYDKIGRDSKPLDSDSVFDLLPKLDELNDTLSEYDTVEHAEKAFFDLIGIEEAVEISEEGNEFRRFTVNNETVTYFNGELNFIKSDTYHASLAAYRNQYVVEVPDGRRKKIKRLDVGEFLQVMSERGACSIDEPRESELTEPQPLAGKSLAKALADELNAALYDKIGRDSKPLDSDSVFDLLPKLDELNDTRSDYDIWEEQWAGEDTDRNDRFNRGDIIAKAATDKICKVDPSAVITFDIDEGGNDRFWISFDGIVRTPFATANDAESFFYTFRQERVAETASVPEDSFKAKLAAQNITGVEMVKAEVAQNQDAPPADIAEQCETINDAAPCGWSIDFDTDNNRYSVKFKGCEVTTLDTLSLAGFLSIDEFFAQFKPLIIKDCDSARQFIDDRKQEIAALKEMLATTHDKKSRKKLKALIKQNQRDMQRAKRAG